MSFPAEPRRTKVDIYGANIRPCSDCSTGISEEDAAESVRLGLSQRFGDQVQVTYHSLLDPAVREVNAALLDHARELCVPLPLVVVDGSILQGGGIDYRAILNAVELKSEIGESLGR